MDLKGGQIVRGRVLGPKTIRAAELVPRSDVALYSPVERETDREKDIPHLST